TVGAEFARDAERGSSVSLSEFGDFPDEFRAARENLAVYLQGLGDAGRWSYTVGGRFDDNSAFGSFRTARAGLAYRVTDAVRFRASAGTAFKAPSFFENFASGFTVGNPALRPEQSESAEFGIEATLASGVSLRATGFAQRFTDLVQYTGAPPAAGEPNYYNVAAANAGGVEFEVAADILGVAVAAAHTWTDTRVVDAGFDTGASANFVAGGRLLRRPEHVTTLSLSRQFSEAGSVNLTAIRTGEREDRDFSSFPAGVVFLKPFTTIDVGGELRLPSALLPGASLQLRAENLADAHYEQVFGFRTPGRTLYAGLKFQR
ncbi:MAG: TonB-dependent receptor domain-containing protein, partial [Gemmatimonadaceae bacterium]